MKLEQAILRYTEGEVDAIGFAGGEIRRRTGSAPPGPRLQGRQQRHFFGNVVPRGMLHSPDYSLYMLHRTYH